MWFGVVVRVRGSGVVGWRGGFVLLFKGLGERVLVLWCLL